VQTVDWQLSDAGALRTPSLRSLDGLGARFSLVSLRNGGRWEAPALERLTQLQLFAQRDDTRLLVPALTEFSRGAASFSDLVLTLGLRSVAEFSLTATAAARLTFPQLTNIVGSGNYVADEAAGFEFPALQTLAGPISGIFPTALGFRAAAGSRVILPALAQSPAGRVLFTATGSNSLVSLPLITSLDGPASGSPGLLEAGAGGTIEAPALTRLAGTEANVLAGGRLRWSPGAVTYGAAELALQTDGQLQCGPLTLGTNGILSGNGTLPGALVNGGRVAPGDFFNPGLLTVTGGYTQLVVSGPAALAGTLAVTRSGGLNYAAGQRFPVLTTTARTGVFDTLTGHIQGPVTLQPEYNAATVDLVAP
jgi:hypothetical protein